MMNIEDKSARRALIELYLEAGTTAAEEIALAQWFASHEAEPEEEAVAQLIGLDGPCVEALSEEGEKEFDRIAAAPGRRNFVHRVLYVAAGAAAAVLIGFVGRAVSPKSPDFTPLEIAEEINTLMSIGIEDIESVSARPSGRYILVTAQLKDGSSSTYRMTRNPETGAMQLLSME
ncbi:MAG: hypothetical protein Q4G10_03180 [Bacteroidia bacterium]|nr:hypothetical protein [Bacteroidia bacterium]